MNCPRCHTLMHDTELRREVINTDGLPLKFQLVDSGRCSKCAQNFASDDPTGTFILLDNGSIYRWSSLWQYRWILFSSKSTRKVSPEKIIGGRFVPQ